MELTELRTELIRQHDEVRQLAERVAAVSERARTNPAMLPELLVLLESLHDEVQAHNAFEEGALHEVLPGIDAWGPVRDRLMTQRHGQEHAAILLALRAATSNATAASIADGTATVLRDIAAHMDREEKEFLAADVLRDDLITSGVGG
jgi:Hemerythrin HHE cation binding domain